MNKLFFTSIHWSATHALFFYVVVHWRTQRYSLDTSFPLVIDQWIFHIFSDIYSLCVSSDLSPFVRQCIREAAFSVIFIIDSLQLWVHLARDQDSKSSSSPFTASVSIADIVSSQSSQNPYFLKLKLEFYRNR